MQSVAFIFPGQGSQQVGMGKELAEAFPCARDVFDEIDDTLDEKLSHIIWNGPDDTLRLTVNAQPALMAVSLAVIRVLAEAGITPANHACFVAGHSLGEYSALAAADAFSIASAARVLRLRGRAMQEASPAEGGSMVAFLGLDFDKVKVLVEQAAQGEVCQIANDNAPGQVVVSGTVPAVARAIEIATTQGVKRTVVLPVSAPFHCALMEPAANTMAIALEQIEICLPVVPLVCNVLARPVYSPSMIKTCLVKQVSGTVRWRESVDFMVDRGITSFYEIGSGKTLSGLVKRTARHAKTMSVSTPEMIDTMVKDLGG